MAKFEGTLESFYNYIGPRITNKINSVTRKLRSSKKGICEKCLKKHQLESAHVHTNDRRTIIKRTAEPFTKSGIISCNLIEVEKRIIEAHYPLEKNFLFLCRSCHREYDLSHRVNLPAKKSEKVKQKISSINQSPDFPKLSRISLWAERPTQTNFRIISAYLTLLKSNEFVLLEKFEHLCVTKKGLSVKNFKNNYASMKTDRGNSHGRIFYEINDKVYMHERVMREVNIYFRKGA